MFKKFKFVLLGSCNTGKTCIVYRYINKSFLDVFHSTIGGAFINKMITKDNIDYTLDIWDTAGQERYISLLPMYYRNSNIVFLCFDITDRLTKIEKDIDFWIKQLDTHNDSINRTVLLIATKIDLINDISLEYTLDALKLKYYSYSIITTSSKENINIDEIFNIGLEIAIEKEKEKEIKEEVTLPLGQTLILSHIVPKKTIWKTYCSIL